MTDFHLINNFILLGTATHRRPECHSEKSIFRLSVANTVYRECWHSCLELGQSVCEERVIWDAHEPPLSPVDAESQELVDHQQASCHLLLLQSTRGKRESPPAVLSECRWWPCILEPGLRVGVICHLQRVLHEKEESTPSSIFSPSTSGSLSSFFLEFYSCIQYIW